MPVPETHHLRPKVLRQGGTNGLWCAHATDRTPGVGEVTNPLSVRMHETRQIADNQPCFRTIRACDSWCLAAPESLGPDEAMAASPLPNRELTELGQVFDLDAPARLVGSSA